MEVAIIFGILIGLAIDWAAADAFYKIAQMKGHSDRKYFWWSFLVPPFGMLMVIALPDRLGGAADGRQPSLPDDQLPAL